MRKVEKFSSDDTCEDALSMVMASISSPPVLNKLAPRQPLLAYLAVSQEVVSVRKGNLNLCP